jgi:hypothetical protein
MVILPFQLLRPKTLNIFLILSFTSHVKYAKNVVSPTFEIHQNPTISVSTAHTWSKLS